MDTNTEDPKELKKEQVKKKPAVKTEPPKAKGEGEALTRQFIAFVKKTKDKKQITGLKTNLSDRFQDGSISEKQRDEVLQAILEVEDK